MLSGVLKGFRFSLETSADFLKETSEGTPAIRLYAIFYPSYLSGSSLMSAWCQLHGTSISFLITAVLGTGEETGGNASKLRGMQPVFKGQEV